MKKVLDYEKNKVFHINIFGMGAYCFSLLDPVINVKGIQLVLPLCWMVCLFFFVYIGFFYEFLISVMLSFVILVIFLLEVTLTKDGFTKNIINKKKARCFDEFVDLLIISLIKWYFGTVLVIYSEENIFLSN